MNDAELLKLLDGVDIGLQDWPISNYVNEKLRILSIELRQRLSAPANAAPDKQDEEVARQILNKHYDFPSQRLEYKACLDDFATALSRVRQEERGKTWDKAIAIAKNQWAMVSVGKVAIEHQAEYERNVIVEALEAARNQDSGKDA